MLQELVYTSVSRGLAPDASGFCTVACTDGMATNLESVLVELSGYRHSSTLPAPIAFLHALRRVGGGVYHVVSRVGDCGVDHTGRANVIAHLFALDERDNLPVYSPAALLLQPNLFLTEWQGAPRLLPPRELPSLDVAVTSQPNTVCEQIAEAVKAGHPVSLIFEPGMELLPIIADALSMLPPEKRWQVTFSTFFISSQESAQEKIQIKGILAGSPEMAVARPTPETLCIDLCKQPEPKPKPKTTNKPKSSVGANVMASHMKVKRQILCPHCWHEFDTDQILFISASPDLLGDAKLGDTEQLRFLPMRFDVGGAARDSHGFPCHKLACPNCHLQIPRSLLYSRSLASN